MRQLIFYILLLFLALLPFTSCTNDETDEGLETITPNEPADTGVARVVKIQGSEISD